MVIHYSDVVIIVWYLISTHGLFDQQLAQANTKWILKGLHFIIDPLWGESTSQMHHSDSRVHGANMGPTWVLSAPDGPHVGPMNFAIRAVIPPTKGQ